ncbi:MAG: hypothetical protein L3J13_04570 [Devosiaceae bacterium]|nr:hypothetical protein [Devosiaceae bacterium]
MEQRKTNWFVNALGEVGAVLALFSFFLLTIMHQPIGAGPYEVYRLADGTLPVVCGPQNGADDKNEAIAWCDACRISLGVDLPDAPCGVATRFAIETNAPSLPDLVLPVPDIVGGAWFARGPPRFV